jgi:hypothetical protein
MPPQRPVDQNHLYPEPNDPPKNVDYKPIIQPEVVDESEFINPDQGSYYGEPPTAYGPLPAEPIPHLRPTGFDVTTDPKKQLKPPIDWKERAKKFFDFCITKWWLVLLLLFSLALISLGIYSNLPKNLTPVLPYDKVVAKITAPESAPSGSSATWTIDVTNNETVALQNVEVKLDFDASFRFTTSSPVEPSDPKGTVYTIERLEASGQTGNSSSFTVEGVLSGNIDEDAFMKGLLSYTPEPVKNADNNRRTLEMAPAKTKITAPQIKLDMKPTDQNVQSGADAEIVVTLTNQSPKDISDVRIKMIYPPEKDAFTYKNSELTLSNTSFPKDKPDQDNNIWFISVLPQGKEQTLKVRGTVKGGDGSKVMFKVEIAVKNNSKDYDLLASTSRDVTVNSQPLEVTTFISGKEQAKTFDAGETLSVIISYENKSNNLLRDIQANATLEDPTNLLDFTTLASKSGQATVNGKTLEWRQSGVSQLATLAPGAKGQLSYTIQVKKDGFLQSSFSQTAYVIRPKVDMKSQSSQPVNINGGDYKARGELQFDSNVTFKKQGANRVYTVTWTIRTNQNQVNDVTINTGTINTFQAASITPASMASNVTYDATTGKITFKPGNIPAYSGLSLPAVTLSFDLVVAPKADGTFQGIEVLKPQIITGTDDFTTEVYTSTEAQVSAS